MSDDEPGGEILSSHDDEPLYDGSPVASPPRRRTGVVVGSAALALTLMVGVGVYAAGRISDSGAEPETVLPGSTFAMVKVDLQPGGSQRAAIRDFARRFPAAKIGDVDDLREALVKPVLDSAGLDYATDVKPWLGRRAAVAGFPGPDGKPQVVAALQVTNVQKAKAALAKSKDGVFVAEQGDFLLVALDQSTLDLARAATAEESLAEAADFSSDLRALTGDQVAVAWMDNRRAITAMVAGFGMIEPDGGNPRHLDDYIDTLDSAAPGRVTIGLHATSTYVELLGVSTGHANKSATGRPDDLRRLPDTTVGALYVRDPHGIAANGISGFDLPAQAFGGFGFGVLPYWLFSRGGVGPMTDVPIRPPSPCPTTPSDEHGDAFCYDETPDFCMTLEEDEDCPEPPSKECIAKFEKWVKGDTSKPPPTCMGMPSPFPPLSTPSGRALTHGLLSRATVAGQDAQEEGDDFGSLLWGLREDLGQGIADDLLPTLRGDTTVVLGSLPAVGTDRASDFAVLADVSDDNPAEKFADSFKAAFSQRFAEDPVGVVDESRLVLASDAAYLDRLGTGGLGSSELFKLAMGDLDDVQVAVFANLERVRDAVPGYPADLRPVSAVGVSIGQHDGNGYLRIRVVSR